MNVINFTWFRCQCGAAIRISDDALDQPCAMCGTVQRVEIPQPADARVCPYCNRPYSASWGLCPFCEDV